MGTIILVAGLALFLGFFVGYFVAIKNQNLQEQFQNIANQALINNQNELKNQNAITLEDKLKPLSQMLERYQKGVEDYTKDSTREIARLMEQSKTTQETAHRLACALSQNQNIKGQFGEDTLEVVLQASGMCENVHYVKKMPVTIPGAQRSIYPDFTIYLPGNKHIIIDSKLNLESFIKYQNDEDKERHLKDFKTDIRNTIKNLSEKNYQAAQELSSPDFIFMYIPLESSLSILYDDAQIIEYALSKNVILIGTASLIATLRLVQKLLSEEKQRESVIEIAQTGTLLYEKFVDFCENLKNIQSMFKKVDTEFGTTINRFTRGEDSLFKKSEKLKELGIRTAKQIPSEFLIEEEV